MQDKNEVRLRGYAGHDVDVYKTRDGKTVAVTTIGTNRYWTNKETGERQEDTEWHRVVMFGALADIAVDKIKIGSRISIEGRLHSNAWHDEAGLSHSKTEIVASNIEVHSKGRLGANNDRNVVPLKINEK